MSGCWCGIASHPVEVLIEGKPITFGGFFGGMAKRACTIGRSTALL